MSQPGSTLSARTEAMLPGDREILRRRFRGSIFFFLLGQLLLAMLGFWAWIFLSEEMRRGDINVTILVIVTLVALLLLFVSVALVYWLYKRYQLVSAREKTVFTGTVTDSWSRSGGSGLGGGMSTHSRYVLQLGNTDFNVDPDVQRFVPAGAQIELHCLPNSREVLYHVELAGDRRRAWQELTSRPQESLFKQIFSFAVAFFFR
ncbi:MAG: hypothetical protein ACOY5B_07200 [Spirochaetota bacterium]